MSERSFEINIVIMLAAVLTFILIQGMIEKNQRGPIRVNLSKISSIESSDCKFIHGPRNEIGCYQITPAALSDVNQHTSREYTMEDLLNKEISRWVADQYINYVLPEYLKRLSIPDSEEYRLVAYNWGIRNLKEWHRSGAQKSSLPKITREYLGKYKD